MFTDEKTDAPAEITPADWAHLVPSIFARCVGSTNYRFDLSRPFVVDGYLYATDARIAVRIPAPAGWTIPNQKDFYPRPFIVFDEPDPIDRVRVNIPEVAGSCDWCGGSGWSGPAACHCPNCGYVIDLPGRPCDECWGSKVDRASDRLEVVPGYWVGRGYAAILREHGVTSLRIPANLDSTKIARFALGDLLGEIQGALMPMTPPDAAERAEMEAAAPAAGR